MQVKVPTRAKTLLSLIRQHDWKIGAELGVWDGRTSHHLLSSPPWLLTLYGVDVWTVFPGGPKDKNTGVSGPKTQEEVDRARASAYRVQGQYPERFQILEGLTTWVVCEVPNTSLDFIFVDASHKTDDVVADVRAWIPKVKPGGAILGHDADWPSILQALCILEFHQPEFLPGNVWLWWKP